MSGVVVDPQAQAVLDRIAAQMAQAPTPREPLSEAERVDMVRQGYRATAELAGDPEPVHSVRDLLAPTPAGGVPVRLYRPGFGTGAEPLLIWFHGGSFVAGNLDTHDRPLRALANRLGCSVAAVAWRLAPEHPYLAGVEDGFAVLQWAAASPDVDPARVAVGGDSAGGAVAAVLAQIAHSRGGPAIKFQVLIYPNTDLTPGGADYPSWRENDGRVLVRSDMERNFTLYAGGADRSQPGLSPMRARDIAGLPPAFVVTGEADPQRDEGEAYVELLRAAGVPVEHVRYPGTIHGFFQMGGVVDAGRDVIARTAAAVRSALGVTSAPA